MNDGGARCSRFLLTLHDAGGTVPPMLALARALIDRGHEVLVLSQPSVQQRAKDVGCSFEAFSSIPDYDRHRPIEDQIDIALPALTGRTVGDDLIALATRHGVDLVVIDANLAGALAAAESLGRASVVLLHSMYKTFVDTWFGDLWPILEPAINSTRQGYGLPPAHGWPSVFAGHDRLLAVVPKVFDAPTKDRPTRMRNFGFLVPPAGPSDISFPDGDGASVLVGLSTTYQRQESLLGAISDALRSLAVRAVVTTAGHGGVSSPSRNVAVTDFAAHGPLLAEADVMITHAGLGSVAHALSFGVPLVCAPLGRDQHLNAQRVTELGTGIDVGDAPTAGDIGAAVERVLADHSYSEAARRLAQASAGEGGAPAAAADIESLCRAS